MLDQEIAPICLTHPDPEVFEIIDLIHSFGKSADFSDWITDKKFTHKINQEHCENHRYGRSWSYELDGSLFFDGRMELSLDSLPEETIQCLVREKTPMFSKDRRIDPGKKVNVSRIISEPFYTIFSKLCFHTTEIGFFWEIYTLPVLVAIYQKKNDPFRFWRTHRR